MTSPNPDPLAVPGLDPSAAQRWGRHKPSSSPWLHEEVATRMISRLQWFKETPSSWLHWEPAVGGLEAHARLREIYPQAACHVWARHWTHAHGLTLEPARRPWNPAQWRRAREVLPADAEAPVAMLWANMALHHEPFPQEMLRSWYNLLKPDGFVMFSCLGSDSLSELRGVYAQMGWPDPAHTFTDMHDWGDMLVASGFAEPVMDMEHITLSFSSASTLLKELRELGRNLNTKRFQGLRGRSWHAALCAAIEAHVPRGPDGRLLLTFELVYGHAFKPQPRVPMAPEQTVSVDAMRAMLRSGRQ